MNGGVTRAADGAEELLHLGGQRAGVAQPLEQVDLLLLRQGGGHAQVRSRALGEHLGELPQLDDGRGGVVSEVPFRERAERDQQRVVLLKKPENSSDLSFPPRASRRLQVAQR